MILSFREASAPDSTALTVRNFGFDTFRLKENNTRIQFDDDSTSAGFPNNNWQIRANDSGSGGSNFLGFVDQGVSGNSETGTLVFAVNAGASANSLRVGSNSKVGLRTATPVLDVHANTTDTPAIRLEQNNSADSLHRHGTLPATRQTSSCAM
jgi:hypothetical protein